MSEVCTHILGVCLRSWTGHPIERIMYSWEAHVHSHCSGVAWVSSGRYSRRCIGHSSPAVFLFCVRSSVFIFVVVLKRSTLWYVYCHVLLYFMFHVHVSELLKCTHTRLGFVFACGQAMMRQGPCVHDVWPGGGRNTRIENRRSVSTVIARLFSSCVWVWFSLAHGS